MSRALLTCSLLLACCSMAFADRATEPRFAQPPAARALDVHDAMPDLMTEPGPPPTKFMAPPTFDRATLRAALVAQRHANLARFRAYQRKGVFPNNTFVDRKLNVWRDDAGNFCAAATMIKMSGSDELVSRVADQSNFIRLADVRQGPLMDWILTSGLTQDEVVAIQEPFMPITTPARPVMVDAQRRRAEDARLRAIYRTVERAIVRNEKASIDLATERLMKHQALAWRIIARTEG